MLPSGVGEGKDVIIMVGQKAPHSSQNTRQCGYGCSVKGSPELKLMVSALRIENFGKTKSIRNVFVEPSGRGR